MSDSQDGDLQDHIATWRGFTRLLAWSVGGIAVILLALLAITFL